MSARDEILGRIRRALSDVPPDEVRAERRSIQGTQVDVVGLFAERVADYRASVHHCETDTAAATIAELFAEGARVVVPEGFPPEMLPDSIRRVRDDPATPLPHDALDGLDAVITTCTIGIAVTGTVVLDHGPGQGRRALTLVPDVHVCVIRADQIVADVPDAFARLDPSRVQTWISGPSATSDIELERVEGVHGPRRLHVLIVEPPSPHPPGSPAIDHGGVAAV